jgi:hypothetical protein
MYLVSPFYIKFLYKNPNRARLSSIVIALISIAVSIVLHFIIYDKGETKAAEEEWFWKIYVTPWCRLSPYIFGMIAALQHRADKERKILENSSVCVEWLAFLMFFWTGF